MKKEYEVRLMRHLHGFYESRLDLLDIDILNPYTNFECRSYIQNRTAETKTISFGIKGKENFLLRPFPRIFLLSNLVALFLQFDWTKEQPEILLAL